MEQNIVNTIIVKSAMEHLNLTDKVMDVVSDFVGDMDMDCIKKDIIDVEISKDALEELVYVFATFYVERIMKKGFEIKNNKVTEDMFFWM